MKKVSVILVNYNFGPLIVNAIKSVNETKIDCNIVVFDNNSRDDSVVQIEALNHPNLTIIKSNENIGFSAGCNRVYEYLSKQPEKPDFIFLLNPDASLTPGLIGELVDECFQHNASIASPKIVSSNGEPYFTGGYIDFRKFMVVNLPGNKTNSSEVSYTNLFHGAAVLIDFNVYEKVGMLNEDLFMYYDEADFSTRLARNNYKILFVPRLEVKHNVSYSTKGNPYLKAYYLTRNYLYFFYKYSEKSRISKLLRTNADIIKVLFWLYLRKGKFSSFIYSIKGYRHFVAGKMGKLDV